MKTFAKLSAWEPRSFECTGTNISQENFPHFSLELSNKHQVDRIVRKISLSPNLVLLWWRPQTQKQGILETTDKEWKAGSQSKNDSPNSEEEKGGACTHSQLMPQGIYHYKETAQTVWINKGGLSENTWNAAGDLSNPIEKSALLFSEGPHKTLSLRQNLRIWREAPSPPLAIEKNILLDETVEGLAGTEAWNSSRAISPFQLSGGKYGADDTKYSNVTRQIQRKYKRVSPVCWVKTLLENNPSQCVQ